MTDRTRSTSRGPWTLSPAIVGAVVVGLICLVAAFVLSRLEPALVGAPLLLAAALGWDRRPARTGPDAVEVEVLVRTDEERPASASTVAVAGSARTDARADALQVRIEPADRPAFDAVLTPRAAEQLRVEVSAVHSGPQRLLGLAARVIGPDAAWVGAPGPEASVERVVRPPRIAVRSLPLPSRLLGLTGQHVSSRPGDGGEFRDIDRFRPGDRLRRIDWRATARAGQEGDLFVRRTTATSDAAIQLVLDARDDVTGVVADWPRPHPRAAASSLDLAREAAAALARAYSAAGDRVGFDDATAASRVVPARAGARHRERVLRAVERTRATGLASDRVRPPRLAPGALVYLLSTFLDDQPVDLALAWRASGHRVIAVDVLPPRDSHELTVRERLALRTVEVERRLRLEQLAASGAELVVWADPADRAARLRRLATPGRRR
ncbi:DUF58 domain-containing protein [Leifsonia sp. F6_8S_P_1B]|uniref:DUF58 domain-containing protein n=1 Tax=Leifsonia williamsii TaxID=3035919 RepID=A0ABT8KD89_9MICO|nr:DUF58 domain-containing protein [Leifsonia williamsii]MDN4615416.1 DUF58 domain-containing protein [Leifsonia williamsii]